MDSSLPLEVQSQLHSVGTSLPANISQLDIIAKSYAPLAQKYHNIANEIARIALHDFSEDIKFTASEADKLLEQDVEVLHFAAKVLNAPDSVYEVKKLAKESKLLAQPLTQLQQYKDIELSPPTPGKWSEVAPTIASTDRVMQAFLDTFEEWSDVYRRLADS